ncbi:MAG: hypothetical protein AAGK32_11995 [Actinomycetota bacterium]
MRIVVTESAPAPALHDPDDFTAFAVEAPEGSEGLAAALDGFARVEGGHAWIEPEAVARLAGERAGDEDWQAGLAAMVAYAAEKGFLSETGEIRAHVEWVQPSP